MKQAWDGRIKADARHLPIADESVQCIVTSPPYWGLRDYGSRDQIGLERTLEEYVETMRAVALELWRVLKSDGTLWLNLGDCYHSGDAHRWKKSELQRGNRGNAETVRPNRLPQLGLKDKDLCGVPWRVAFALQSDGWWLRSDIIWAKKSCMPESVTDRPTRAHEYLFLFAKSEEYYYDHEAIKEQSCYGIANSPQSIASPYGQGFTRRAAGGGKKAGDIGHTNLKLCGTYERSNKRDVWHLATIPYSGAHYAVFPQKLVEPCILAGSRPGDLVLDPFFGSGTVGRVCERFSRRWIGCDLAYQDLQLKRVTNVQKELMLR